MTTATKETLVVTKRDLAALADLEQRYSRDKRDLAALEKEVQLARLALAEKVLGVNSADELKELSPEQVQKRYAKRLCNGDWRPASNAPGFVFRKTNEGRYPAWARLFIDELGETTAARIKAETPVTYSYCVEVTGS